VPKSLAGKLVMRGTGSGSFALDIEEVNGNETLATTTFAAVPSSTSTTATIDINPASSPTANALLKVDFNGDGTIDSTLNAKQGAIVTPDFAPPEIKLIFSTSTNALSFIGIDDRDGILPVTSSTTFPALKKNQKAPQGTATTTLTARDASGNTTSLVYMEKLPSPDHRDTIVLNSLTYNGATVKLDTASVSYKFQLDNSGGYKLFASFIQTSATSTEAHWRPKKGFTVVMTKPQDLDDANADDDADTRPVKLKVPGMIVPFLTTSKGAIRYSW
jgi:hypothetical protein